MFLMETATRHSILMKHKHFRDKIPKRLQSNSSKLMGETREEAIDVDNAPDEPVPLREEDDEDSFDLGKIPQAPGLQHSRKRHRTRGEESGSDFDASGTGSEEDDADDSDDVQEIRSDSESAPPTKRARQNTLLGDQDPDDKKKMAMDISYEGFALYGMVLCLVVKRRETGTRVSSARSAAPAAASTSQQGGSHSMMENWISSTQMPAGMDDDAEGVQ